MLLTSSQVSFAISSVIVISCTLALFLSGYTIQQRTVRNLRAAIRPDNSPQIFLPDRFRDATTELADGSIVMLDEYDRPVRIEGGRVSLGHRDPADAPPQQQPDDEPPVDVVPVPIPPVLEDEDQQKPVLLAPADAAVSFGQGEGTSGEAGAQGERLAAGEFTPGPGETHHDEGGAGLHQEGVEESAEKPESPAERRRRIKEEIHRLAQGEQPVYYQRRLW